MYWYIYIKYLKRRTVKCPSNHIPRPEDYDRLSYIIIVILCALYCNVFLTGEWDMRWQRCIQPSIKAVSHCVAG